VGSPTSTKKKKEGDVMAILVITFWNWKPEVTEGQRNNFMKKSVELFEKHDFVKLTIPYAFASVGSNYRYVAIFEYPNYAAIDKVLETPELLEHVSEFRANCKDLYQMILRTLPIP
jgi:hypothetical protein